MRTRIINILFTVLAAMMVTLVGADALFAQGKGRGGGNKGDRGQPAARQQRGGKDRQARAPGPPMQRGNDRSMRQQPRPQMQRGNDRAMRQQPRPQQVDRRQQKDVRRQRNDEARQQQIRRQDDMRARQEMMRRQNDARRQAQAQNGRGQLWQGRQDKRGQQIDRRPDRKEVRGRRAVDVYGTRANVYDDRRARKNGRKDDRGSFGVPRYDKFERGNHAWPNNYGYERSQYVHERNAARKAAKDYEKSLRRSVYDPYYSYGGYYVDRTYPRYDRRDDWYRDRDRFLRSVIFTSAAPGVAYYDNYYEPYYPSYFGGSVFQASYGPVTFSYFSEPRWFAPAVFPTSYAYVNNYYYDPYQPVYYDPYRPLYYGPASYSGSYVQASIGPVDIGFYSQPVWTAYPYGYVPPSANYYAPVGGYNDYYAPVNYYDPYYPDIYADDFPVAYIVSDRARYGVDSEIYSGLIAYGYDQGYNDGVAAAYAGYDDRYRDPYVYQETVYDPYSYSVGANRRCLSEGYELGYRDAVNDQRYYGGYRDYDVDLVGVLIGDGLNIGVRF